MSINNPLFERSHILIGDEGIARLEASHVLVAGIGGVGSYTAEALARLGVGQLTLVDHDVVSPSNLNRQLIALNSTVNRLKISVMAERIKDINPTCRVTVLNQFLSPESIPPLLEKPFDVVIDAIDSMSSKAALIETAWHRDITLFFQYGCWWKVRSNSNTYWRSNGHYYL